MVHIYNIVIFSPEPVRRPRIKAEPGHGLSIKLRMILPSGYGLKLASNSSNNFPYFLSVAHVEAMIRNNIKNKVVNLSMKITNQVSEIYNYSNQVFHDKTANMILIKHVLQITFRPHWFNLNFHRTVSNPNFTKMKFTLMKRIPALRNSIAQIAFNSITQKMRMPIDFTARGV